ncbi:sigma 54-interacting transcriptional regulator [candidate division CSSED10-310 bacterium]|uniref:Sigma 54-interacting transcriptional regulator n=1 Tax=candidate division CSSED10-310 bacterium TaxID=2855610 RepID=A0ABV6YTQ6_UNCC1
MKWIFAIHQFYEIINYLFMRPPLLLKNDDGTGIFRKVSENIDQEATIKLLASSGADFILDGSTFKIYKDSIWHKVLNEGRLLITREIQLKDKFPTAYRPTTRRCTLDYFRGSPFEDLIKEIGPEPVMETLDFDQGILLPFFVDGTIVGGLLIAGNKSNRINFEKIEVVQTFCKLVGSTCENIKRQSALQENNIQLQREYTKFKEKILSHRLEHPDFFVDIITRDPKMYAIFQYIEAIAATDRPVLIEGETGVGKELLARSVHSLSGRTGHFIAINVAGIDDTVFSDTLFGHLKGSFTDAHSKREGLVEKARDGTLFLDEIGDLTIPCQVKLLRLSQEKEYFPLGADLPKKSQTRIVMATNSNLKTKLVLGEFRKDLYYRLQPNHIYVPPLRERLKDLPLLVNHFLEKASQELNKKVPTIPRELFELLSKYDYPGNIRELEGMIFEVVRRHTSGVISLDYLKEHISSSHPMKSIQQLSVSDTLLQSWPVLPAHKEVTNILIAEALRRTNGNKAAAARLIGMTRSGLIKSIKRRMSQSKNYQP